MRPPTPCPKCSSTDIIRVPAVKGAYGTGNFITFGLWSSKRVPVTRYMCANCGFTEEWIDEASHIAELRQRFGERWQ